MSDEIAGGGFEAAQGLDLKAIDRRDAIEQLKKESTAGEIPEDDEKHAEAEVQKLTDQYIKKIDEHLAHKEKEIMTV